MKYCDNHGAPQRDAALPDRCGGANVPDFRHAGPCWPASWPWRCALEAVQVGPPPGTPTRRLAAGLRRQKSRCRRKRPPARRRHPRPPPLPVEDGPLADVPSR